MKSTHHAHPRRQRRVKQSIFSNCWSGDRSSVVVTRARSPFEFLSNISTHTFQTSAPIPHVPNPVRRRAEQTDPNLGIANRAFFTFTRSDLSEVWYSCACVCDLVFFPPLVDCHSVLAIQSVFLVTRRARLLTLSCREIGIGNQLMWDAGGRGSRVFTRFSCWTLRAYFLSEACFSSRLMIFSICGAPPRQ